jgi:hypothetical protein
MKHDLVSSACEKIDEVSRLISEGNVDGANEGAELAAAWLFKSGRDKLANQLMRVHELLEIKNFYGAKKVVDDTKRRLSDLADCFGEEEDSEADCQFCNEKILDSHNFCMHCGASQKQKE